jgi:hypothetical protein
MTVSYPEASSPLTRRPKRLHPAVAVAGLLMFAGGASASELVYQPIDPAFGGNPFNGPFLIDTAKIQNGDDAKDKRTVGSGLSGISGLSDQEQFVRILQSRLLSDMASKVADAIFGENAQDSGEFKQAGAGQIDGKISQKNGTENYALLDQSDGVSTANTLTSATITQDGTGSLSSTVVQSGDHNAATVTQGGSSNIGNVTQNGADNTATVGQTGSGSQAYIEQLGNNGQVYVGYGAVGQDGDEYAYVKQTGASEIAMINQAGAKGSNYTWLEQSGANAYSDIHQNGYNGTLTATQSGSGAALSLWQSGETNTATVDQHGTFFTYAEISQSGIGNGTTLIEGGSANTSAFLSQSGNGNGMLVTQNATGGIVSASVVQSGDRNYAGVNQTADNVRGSVLQSGDDNHASLSQLVNAGAVASITQSGNGGVATINQ